MPSHPERVRTASLPEGYQFGDAAGKPRLAFHPDAFRLVMDVPTHFMEVFGIGTFTKPYTSDRDLGDER